MRSSPSLFDAVDPRLAPPAPPTRAERLALKNLTAAGHLGLTRVPGGYRAGEAFVSLTLAARLCARGEARRDATGRHPRLKITARGRAILGDER